MTGRLGDHAGAALDLFAGAGGSTQGLKDAGVAVLGAIENDPYAAKTFRNNHPEVRLFELDIRTVCPRVVREALQLDPCKLTILNACPPCQGYSSLGARDEDDIRNELVADVVRFVRELLPRAFIVENVSGLAGDRRLASLIGQASALGYVCASYRVEASWFGVPQRRRRLIVIGLMGASAQVLPDDLRELAINIKLADRITTAGEAIELAGPIGRSEDPLHRARNLRPHVRKRLEHIPVGGSRFDLPYELQLECHKKLKGRNATGAYGRVRADELAPTMTTRCTTPACGPFAHPTENRGLSLREAALIQSFPNGYQFQGAYADIERQIGNAVPVRMAEGIVRLVLRLTAE